jgi:hypothetical protein
LLPTMPMATTTTTTTTTAIVVAMRGDGYCPDEKYSSDPDCAREGAQWRGSGRVDDTDSQAKSGPSRDDYPRCRNWETSEPRPAGCRRRANLMASAESDKRNQWPDRTPQPGHLG